MNFLLHVDDTVVRKEAERRSERLKGLSPESTTDRLDRESDQPPANR